MRRVVIPVLLFGILGLAGIASADPIRTVTAGSIDRNEDSSSFLLIGSGLRLSGEGPYIDAISPSCVVFIPCVPGTAINLSTSVTPSVMGDSAVVDGTTYGGYNYYGGVFLDGHFNLDAGSISVPTVAADGIGYASTPFTFTGILRGFDNFDLSGTPLFALNLRGGGIATMEFSNQPQFGGIFTTRLTYNFEDTAPVPEPATIFLIGSGLCGLAMRRKRT